MNAGRNLFLISWVLIGRRAACAGYSINIIEEAELCKYPEVTRMRGFALVPHEEASVQTECGKAGPVVFTTDDWNRLR